MKEVGIWFLRLAGFLLAAASVACASSSAGSQKTPPATFRAGAAKLDITPDYPVALEGYGNPENRISEGIHDRLYARAIAFESRGRRLVLVSCDLSGFHNSTFPAYQKAILNRFGLRSDELFVAGTHTHSGPFVFFNRSYPHPNNFIYTESLRQKLVTVIDRALRSLSPANLSVGRGSSRVAANRRLKVAGGPGEKDRVIMARNVDGPVDREVLVLEVMRPDGTPVASLFDYACHSRSLNSQNRKISGDIFGIAEQTVEKTIGERFISAAFSGAAGNIDPWDVLPGFDDSGGRTPETVQMGNSLGDEVVRVLQGMKAAKVGGEIRTASMHLALPGKYVERPTKYLDLFAARIGDIGFLGVNCEVLTEIGLEIKAASPFKHTFIITICNGGEGYLPPKHLYEEGGYEVNLTGFDPEASGIFVQNAVRMLTELAK